MTKISETGFFDGMDIEEYHSDCCDDFSASSGDLVTVEDKGLAKYWAFSYMNPNAYERPERPAYTLGKLAHTLIIGGEVFDDTYVVKPFDFRSKQQKLFRDHILEDGYIIITQDDLDTAEQMAEKIMQDPLAMNVFSGGSVERSMFWKNKGIWVKARPDWTPKDSLIIPDYKKTRRDKIDLIRKDITNFGYTMKMANIASGIMHTMPEVGAQDYNDFLYVLVFQEDVAPFTVTVVEIDPKAGYVYEDGVEETADRDSIYWAACQNQRSINRISRAKKTGEWLPPHGGGAVSYAYPQWLADRLSDEQANKKLPNLNARLQEQSA